MALDPTSTLFAAVLRAQRVTPERALMLDVEPGIAAAAGIAPACWTAVAPWRPLFDALSAAGFAAHPVLPNDATGFDLALVRLGRQRARNLGRIAEALRRVSDDALVVVAGENEIGAAAYGKPLGRPASLSKHHARAFWLRADAAPPRAIRDAWEEALRLRPQGEDGHLAAPGVFAWDRIDPGSALLAATLPTNLSGVVADLGGGWGYLAREIVARCPAVTRLELFEADWHALEAARANLSTAKVGFHWHDVTRDLPPRAFDAVVSNPPFHATRRADPTIGQRVIRNAATALRADGALWLVANRHLPYETTLRECFAQVETRTEAEGYKVIVARAPRRQNVPG